MINQVKQRSIMKSLLTETVEEKSEKVWDKSEKVLKKSVIVL